MEKIREILSAIYLVIGAVIYVIIYGGIILIISFFISLFNKEKANRFVMREIEKFGRNAYRILWSPVIKYGEKPEGHYIVIANHQSILDVPLIIGCIGPVAFLAKIELSKVPGVSWFFKCIGGVYIKRGDTLKTAGSLKEMMRKIKNGRNFVIFPEGTRSEDGTIGEFKKGSLGIPYKLKTKIVPVSIWGNHKLIRKESLIINPTKVYIKIHKSVDPSNFSCEEDLRNYLRETIVKGVEELRRNENEKSHS